MPAPRFRLGLLASAFAVPDDARSDGELLRQFLACADETAFAILVARHTPTVRAACRCWLRSSADIDDAAQATFLVLVRRASSIRNPAALSRWLYRVAENIARRLRRQLAKAGPLPADIPDHEPAPANELADALMEEVARLPERYRLPLQLCYTAGLTTAAVAERLGCPKGTILTRLARGRDLLQRRLMARGAVPVVLLASTARGVDSSWVWMTTRAAKSFLAGECPVLCGVAERTVTLTEGAVRIMLWNKLKIIVVAAMLATGLVGFTAGQWVAADPSGPFQRSADKAVPPALPPAQPAPPVQQSAKVDEAKPPVAGRRREAVIRVPVGTFVKEVEVAPYGSGRLTWTFEEDRIHGTIEASVMGVEVELATEAEFSLSSNGTIYGIITNMRVNHIRFPQGATDWQVYFTFLPLIEPLIADMTTDLPFSYQFRQSGDRLSIHNFRMLLAGPNPLGRIGPFVNQIKDIAGLFLYFQAIGVAIEGTYTASDGKEAPKPRPMFKKSGNRPTPKYRSQPSFTLPSQKPQAAYPSPAAVPVSPLPPVGSPAAVPTALPAGGPIPPTTSAPGAR